MKTFFLDMLSSKDNVSSKRFFGMVCFIVYFCIFASTYFVTLSPIQITMSNQILYVGGSLLGVSVFEKLFLNKQTKQ